MSLKLEEKPREKLVQHGAESLTLSELMALIIETGTKNESVISVANRIVMRFRELDSVEQATIKELQKINGIGLAKSAKIVAALEFGKRLNQQTESEKYMVKSPSDAVSIVKPELRFLYQEHFHCVFLNIKNQIIHRETVFIGSLNMSVVHPREVFRIALRVSAASLICFHNHPSGDPTPSKEDIKVTKRLAASGELLGVRLLDHIIIAQNKHLSMREKSYF
ncbi:hypothetical protein X560_0538 [Listeria fleischmannii 1991]|uniref:MPN domain-containing protein n=2 Tax=Listeria fleischmannii TaxID=1069827 RepID=A0A0J8GDT2_9LIST|nr:DNA repair protein RadC [Listeria fleischmannii]KMT60847.1 hypothetical protein X560_0538 [Listeria fleischmannii 1991]